MYWEYFGFKEPPFALTPNPAFLFLSSPHQEAFAHLLFAIESRAGFIELSGEVGTGKTTIIRTLLNQLERETHRTALIFNPTLSPLGLFREINAEFGLSSASSDLRELHQELNAFLLVENRAGNTVVLVIDEAQNLSIEVLEQLRLISNLETDRSKLIQIVLVGQPELRTLLARPELRQLNQRITVRYHLKPMELADTCDYIRHRIRFAAGGSEPLGFSAGAARKIFGFSGGLPRLVNVACDRALLLAYTRETREVSPSMASACIAELRRETPQRWSGSWTKAAAVVSGLAMLFGAAWWTLRERDADQTSKAVRPALAATNAAAPGTASRAKPATTASRVPSNPAAATATSQAPGTVFSRELALRGLAADSEADNLRTSVNAVLAAWRSQPFTEERLEGTNAAVLARLRGMTATRIEGNLDAISRMDVPALLQVTVPGVGKRLVALTAVGPDQVKVEPALAGRGTLSRAELAQVWGGGAILFWKDFHGIANRSKPAEQTVGIKLLQGLLQGAGCFSGPANGMLGPKTVQAVSEFQRREGLAVDGKAKGLTLLMLYRRAGGFFPPTLQQEVKGSAGAVRRSDATAGKGGA